MKLEFSRIFVRFLLALALLHITLLTTNLGTVRIRYENNSTRARKYAHINSSLISSVPHEYSIDAFNGIDSRPSTRTSWVSHVCGAILIFCLRRSPGIHKTTIETGTSGRDGYHPEASASLKFEHEKNEGEDTRIFPGLRTNPYMYAPEYT